MRNFAISVTTKGENYPQLLYAAIKDVGHLVHADLKNLIYMHDDPQET